MSRIPFSQVLKNASVDIRKEYDRLFKMFHFSEFGTSSLRRWCDICFKHFDFRDTCISLDDFDETHDFHFDENPQKFDINYLISFCEYSYNLVCQLAILHNEKFYKQSNAYLLQVVKVIEKMGYMANKQDNLTDFVPKDQAAISVAEIVDPNLSYKVIEYNHHSMKGDIERKKAILLALAEKLEPRKLELENIDNTLKSDLFFLLNCMNIRHNNVETDRKFVTNMSNEELEKWYDETYQICLLAFLELDNLERKSRIKELKEKSK